MTLRTAFHDENFNRAPVVRKGLLRGSPKRSNTKLDETGPKTLTAQSTSYLRTRRTREIRTPLSRGGLYRMETSGRASCPC